MLIRGSREGNRVDPTKTGTERRVALSRRGRAHLLARFLEAGRPAQGPTIRQVWAKNVHARLDRATKAAKVGRFRPKDLRDTYASTLITHGIVAKRVSLQLGHASFSVTERHYARYMAVDGYPNPWPVPEGCLPPDLFAELDGWNPTRVTTASTGVIKARK